MELKIKPHDRNLYPLGGVLVKGASAAAWIKELQAMHLVLDAVKIYPVPNTTPNSVWGCFVVTESKVNTEDIGRNERCQRVAANLYIPERSILHPAVTLPEIAKLLSPAPHIMHPDFGMVELQEELQLQPLLALPVMKSYIITAPTPPAAVPMQVKSFQIHAVPPEEMLQQMEEQTFPKREPIETRPLNLAEKVKLALYKLFFKTSEGKNGIRPVVGKTESLSKLDAFLNKLFKGESKLVEKMQQDYEDLEERNKNELQKLLDMLRDNPDEALKYAIPINEGGTTRGGVNESLNLSKRWGDLSLFGNRSYGGSGGHVDLGEDGVYALRAQYNNTALELLKQKDYRKAAFVYLKLLKSPTQAAEALVAGELYQEAASVYLKYSDNKRVAADCYRKGHMNNEAIELYKELNENELVGDLYLELHKRKEADVYFQKTADKHKSVNKYIQASQIYQEKMNDVAGAQQVLFEGWKNKIQPIDCLKKYFGNIADPKTLNEEIKTVYTKDITEKNRQSFLEVIKHEYQKKNESAETVKEMAYEIIAAEAKTNPAIVSELKTFNEKDNELIKDTIRFKLNKK